MSSTTAAVVAESAAWDGPTPQVAAVVATYQRAGFLAELVAALEAQDLPPADVEVVLVDNGSTDGTADELARLAATTSLRLRVVRMERNRGPAPGRNAGVRATRAPIVAITDDDCLPTPGWLRGILAAFADGADVVQGTVHADPVGRETMGPWDHTIWVTVPTPFFETCNVAYRRSAFDRAGGFDEDDPLLHPPSGRAFGEDACLAWEVQRTGGRAAFTSEALVHHRCIPSTYERWLADQRELAGFPGLARRSPLVARMFVGGLFLSRRSARFDLAVASLVAAVLLRRPVLVVLTLPWAWMRWKDAVRAGRSRRAAPALLARLAWSDTVALGALLRGSVRHRRPVL